MKKFPVIRKFFSFQFIIRPNINHYFEQKEKACQSEFFASHIILLVLFSLNGISGFKFNFLNFFHKGNHPLFFKNF